MNTATGLWPYALDIYARPGVSALCIKLQDEHGVDNCLILAALWCASLGLFLDRPAVAALDAACEHWRRAVVAPLRRQRRAWSANTARREDYAAIKELELGAERLQLARLEALCRQRQGTDDTAPRQLAGNNLDVLLAHYGMAEPLRRRIGAELLRLIAR